MNPRLEALLRLLPLERLPRTGWILAGIPEPESVAAHSLSTALVALALGPSCRPALDVDRAVALAVVHDVPEALLGDLPRRGSQLLPPGAKALAEERARSELLEPLSELAHARGREFQAAETREARFARLCDKLALGVRLLGYQRAGWTPGGDFRQTIERLDCSEFKPCLELQRALLEVLETR